MNSIKLVITGTLLAFIITQSCETTNPSIIMDCSKLSTATNSCCFYKTSDKVAHCGWYGSKISDTKTKDGNTWHCDNPRGATCGAGSTATSPAGCGISGAPTNSCCMAMLNNVKSCIWWAEKFDGTTTFNGMTVTCDAGYFRMGFALLVALMILF
jgi:hypothetical protein